MNSFMELLEIHSELDALFAEHQYALLHFDFELALRCLCQYESLLEAHMSDEERVLLPLYAERADIEKGGAVELFLSEHEKMRRFVGLFAETTDRLATEAVPEPLVLTLLDREAFYRRLCSHHDIRESKVLYPALDKVTSEKERSDLFGRFSASSLLTRPASSFGGPAVGRA